MADEVAEEARLIEQAKAFLNVPAFPSYTSQFNNRLSYEKFQSVVYFK